MPRYTEFEHTADIGVEVYGETLEALLQNAAYALFETIADVHHAVPTVSRSVTVTGEDAEMLLMNWLRELLYLFAIHQEIYTEFTIESLTSEALTATIHGVPPVPESHNFYTEIKAITYHQFSLTHMPDNTWTARVIFDV